MDTRLFWAMLLAATSHGPLPLPEKQQQQQLRQEHPILQQQQQQQQQQQEQATADPLSKWARRTARKRQRTGEWLTRILGCPDDKNNTTGTTATATSASKNHDSNNSNHGRFIPPTPPMSVAPWNAVPVLDCSSSSSSLLSSALQDDSLIRGIDLTTRRAQRKRLAVQAFCHVTNYLLVQQQQRQQPCNNNNKSAKTTTATRKPLIVDACSGAGNLAFSLAHYCSTANVLALDINAMALQRLEEQHQQQQQDNNNNNHIHGKDDKRITTLCIDLASPTLRLPDHTAVICSLHACGAASDLAIRLATLQNIPFVVSPCCTAKALTTRQEQRRSDAVMMSSSRQRSAAPESLIQYPRSQWLKSVLSSTRGITTTQSSDTPLDVKRVMDQNDNNIHDKDTTETCAAASFVLSSSYYETLAKIADVGLGPQTPFEQRNHQKMAKYIVECDRLAHVVEQFSYTVQLWHLPVVLLLPEQNDNNYEDTDDDDYGKRELLVGVPPGWSLDGLIAMTSSLAATKTATTSAISLS